MGKLTALVLAGRRGGGDATDAMGGAVHRALVPVGGVPMLARVVGALRETPGIERIVVSIDEPAALDASDTLRDLVASGALETRESLASPSRSVLDVLENAAPGERVLVTTADHALLRAEMVAPFVDPETEAGADVLVGVVEADAVRARYPEAVRTWLRLRDGNYTGANLFLFRNEQSRGAAAFWVRAERFRKQPWRLVSVFGPGALLLFLLRRLDLAAALARVSRAVGAEVRAVRLPFADAAIDVDRPSDLDLAERILAEREGA